MFLKSTTHHTTTKLPKSLLFFSSSSSSPRSKYHNYYLRRRRKWPHPVYKSRWHQKLSHQHAMQTLQHKTSSLIRTGLASNLLHTLIESFALYNCTPSPNAYHFILKTLIKTSNSHHIGSILHHIEKFESFEMPESFLIDLIEFYGAKRDFQEAIELFFKSSEFRCVASVDSLNCLLSVLCREKEGFRVVPSVLVKSRGLNIRLEESSFVILVRGLCKFNKAKEAIRLLCHMVDYEIEVDSKSFSLIMLTLFQQRNMECDEVMGLVGEMKRLGFRFEISDWWNLIRFLFERRKGVEALEALRGMKSDGFKPDVICYTMVLEAVIYIGEYDRADQLFDEMLVMGLVPDINTYNVYVNGLCKQKKFDDGIMMVSSMEEIGCKPNMSTYDTLLSAMYESGELSKASCFLKHAREKGFLLNSETYEVLIYKDG